MAHNENQDGGCQCGQITYRVNTGKCRLNICHCTDCQRQSGSAFGMSLVIPPAAFRLLTGALKEWITTADSGRTKTCAFCPDCGVRIYNRTELMMSIKAGTLNDTAWLQPDGHYFTSTRQPWLAPSSPPNPASGHDPDGLSDR